MVWTCKQHRELGGVFVFSECCNKIVQTGRLRRQNFAHSSGSWNPRSRCPPFGFWEGLFSCLADSCLLTVYPHLGGGRKEETGGAGGRKRQGRGKKTASFYKDPTLTGAGFHSYDLTLP